MIKITYDPNEENTHDDLSAATARTIAALLDHHKATGHLGNFSWIFGDPESVEIILLRLMRSYPKTKLVSFHFPSHHVILTPKQLVRCLQVYLPEMMESLVAMENIIVKART